MSDLNIGLIGSGRIGQVHAGSIADTKGANLAWICDPFVDGATALAAEFGGKVTADPEDVFKSGEVDVIVVASPTPTHLDMIDRAIDEGIHVLCEKPIDLDIAKVEKLRDKANAANVHIAIGFNRRFDPQFESIQKRVAAGEAGKLEQLVILSRDPGPAPRAYIVQSQTVRSTACRYDRTGVPSPVNTMGRPASASRMKFPKANFPSSGSPGPAKVNPRAITVCSPWVLAYSAHNTSA